MTYILVVTVPGDAEVGRPKFQSRTVFSTSTEAANHALAAISYGFEAHVLKVADLKGVPV